MPFTGKMQTYADEVGMPTSVVDYLLDKGVKSINCVAMFTDKEDFVFETMIAPMKSDGVNEMKQMSGPIAVKICWVLCRDDYEQGRKKDDPNSTVTEYAIPDREGKTIAGLWQDRHNFPLLGCQLLTPFQECKVWKEANANPPLLTQWFGNMLRHRGETNPKSIAHTGLPTVYG